MKHETEFKKWSGRLRRGLKKKGLRYPANKGWVFREFFADRTPEEVIDYLNRRA